MTIGNQLKKARQAKHINLDDVHKKTKIHPNVIVALEEDRFHQILNPTYIRSFLKEYAIFLGLDHKNILEEYNALFPKDKTAGRTSLAEDKGPSLLFDMETALDVARKLVLIAAAVILCVVLFRAGRAVFKKSMQRLAVKSTQAEKAKTEKAKKAASSKPKTAQRQKPELKKEAPVRKRAPAGASAIVAANEKLLLTVKTTDDIGLLQVKVDGRIIFQGPLAKGSSETWQAANNFTIWTSKAEATQLSLNGKDLGTPGSGVKKDISITREGLR